MGKYYRQLKYDDRLRFEKLLRDGYTKGEIAEHMKIHRNTVTNEYKRGTYIHLTSDYKEEVRYSADLAEKRYQENTALRGTELKISNDYEFANYIETKIADEGYSPEAVIGELKVKKNPFRTMICVRTVYNYIDKGVFLRITNKDLPVKGKKKRKIHKIKRQKKASAGKPITERPAEVEDRKVFGHWEMDTVIGKKGESKNSLLVLTERKTRKEILFKLDKHEASKVVACLDQLEREWKHNFRKIFKTITVDNGTEFSAYEDMQTSKMHKGNRTELYYCHAYCSWERGTNENQNKLVRRKIPKGSNFDHLDQSDIKEIENWMNHYPRRMFGFHTPEEYFEKEISFIT